MCEWLELARLSLTLSLTLVLCGVFTELAVYKVFKHMPCVYIYTYYIQES